ncbi:MAG: three-Cys-motif partner protein TcmP [Candidatus Pacebacteria bacterium]|nr:three-Cys-motif partner protein TcmP [Candidatus Paceibacterota bacterium]
MNNTKKDKWDLSNKPHTRMKLDIYREYLTPAITIFKKWLSYSNKKIFIVDCFAGRGMYHEGKNKNSIDGSPLIALKVIESFIKKGIPKNKIKCFFVEKNIKNYKDLLSFTNKYKSTIDFKIIHGTFSDSIEKILEEVNSNPCIFFIDPYGIKGMDKISIRKIMSKMGPKDTILNYMKEGVARTKGVIRKGTLNEKEIKTIETFKNFLGDCSEKILKEKDSELLMHYVEEVLKKQSTEDLKILAYDMKSSFKDSIIYYLLFATKDKRIATKIMKQIFKKYKDMEPEKYRKQQTLPNLIAPIKNQFEL